MKRVLVVSDNPLMLNFFQEECARQGMERSATIEYRYSAINKTPTALAILGATAADMKDAAFVGVAIRSYDLIVSVHCKQVFPAELVAAVPCVNVHPGFNPHNRGWYPQVFAIVHGTPAGATIHLMDQDIDHGAIIDQMQVDVRPSDTSLQLYQRVLEAEKVLLRKNLRSLIDLEFNAVSPTEEGTCHSIQDFRSLCRLDLAALGSLREHIDLLRALSHGEFKNAYFLDRHGKKVFVRLTLDE